MPVSRNSAGLKNASAELDFVADGPAVVAEEFHVVVDEGVQPEGGGRKLVGDARIDGRIVALIRGDGAPAQQGGQELVVGDRLNLGDHDGPRPLVDCLVA